MKTTLLAGSLALSLFSTAALADDCDRGAPQPPPGAAYGVGHQDPTFRQGELRSHRGPGAYQLQTTQRWVQGGTQQYWVNGFCHRPPFSPVRVCTAGHYETRQLPGHYENVQQWVWVPRHEGRDGRGYGRSYYSYNR
ncbi:MAG: hypothetical protein IPJ65_41515 [Archangiaceae bacterium]|nr:hypothetical protein [Archangiaceae bacterium]